MAPSTNRPLTGGERMLAASRMMLSGNTRGQSVNAFLTSVMAGHHDEYISKEKLHLTKGQADVPDFCDQNLTRSLHDPERGPSLDKFLNAAIDDETERVVHTKAVKGQRNAPRGGASFKAMHLQALEQRKSKLKERHRSLPDVGSLTCTGFAPIPEMYPPSSKSVTQLMPIFAEDLRLNTHHHGKVLVVQVIAKPAFDRQFLLTIVEDEKGRTEWLQLYHAQRYLREEALPENAYVAIKEPFFDMDHETRWWHIRIDHPSDIVRLTPGSPFLPLSLRLLSLTERMKSLGMECKTAVQWKEDGNQALKAGTPSGLERARRCYTEGLDVATEHEADLMLDLFRNRSYTNLQLGCYDQTIIDAMSSMLSPDTVEGHLTERHQDLNHKSLFRAARAYYQLRQWTNAKESLVTCMRLRPGVKNKEVHELLIKVSARQMEEQTGQYDFDSIIAGLSVSSRVDAADFLKRTEVKESQHRGRGVFAAEDINCGDLILVEKAAHAMFDNDQDFTMDMMYESSSGASVPNMCSFWHAIVRELERNPSRIPEMLDLYDRGYAKDASEGKVIDGQTVIDVFHVRMLVLYNAQCSATPRTSQKEEEYGFSLYNGDRNGGIWPRKSLVNYSCLPNAVRSNIGDLIILRATNQINKGEEILTNFGSRSGDADLEARQIALQSTWGVNCCCDLCTVEQSESASVRSRRRQLVTKFKTKFADDDRNVRAKDFQKYMTDMWELGDKIAKTHDSRYDGLPRVAAIEPEHRKLLAYSFMKKDEVIDGIVKALVENMGWSIDLNETKPRLTSTKNALVDERLVYALLVAANVKGRQGAAAAKTSLTENAALLYRTVNGVDHGFDKLSETVKDELVHMMKLAQCS